MQPQASGTGQPPEQDIGVRVSLSELIDIRHRVREVPLFSTPHRRSPLVGLHHSKLRGRGVDFDQVRVYQAGDDVRTIDWRVTARTQEPHTKLFHEERERPIYIVVEQSPRLFFGSGRQFKSVLAAQAAGLIGWAALSHNDRVGGLVFGSEQQEIKPRRSKQSLLQLLDRITRANRQLRPDSPLDPEAFSLALRRVREVLRPGSLLLLPVFDPLDRALPAAGLLRFSQGNARLELDTHDATLRQRYRELGEARSARWQRLADRLRVPLMPLDTQHDLVEQLREHLSVRHPSARP